MSSIMGSPIGPATAGKRGTMSAADFTKLAAILGTNTGDVALGEATNGLSLAGQTLQLAAAGAGQAGALSTGTQEIAGLKDFLAGLASARGAGASDLGLKLGFTTAYASVHASATLLDLKTGIGGSETSIFKVRKGGSFSPPVEIVAPATTNTVGVNLTGGNAGWGGFHWNPTHGGRVAFGSYDAAIRGVAVENGGLYLCQNSNAYDAAALMKFVVSTAAAVAASVPVFDFAAPSNTQATQSVLRFKVGTGEILKVSKTGEFELLGAGVGIVLASPNGTRHRITVSDAGALVPTPL